MTMSAIIEKCLVSFQFWWLSSHSFFPTIPLLFRRDLFLFISLFFLFFKLLGRVGPEKVPRKRQRPRIFRRKMRKPRRMPRKPHKKRHGPHNKPRRNKPCRNNDNTDSSTVGCSSMDTIHCLVRSLRGTHEHVRSGGRQVTATRGYCNIHIQQGRHKLSLVLSI